MKKTRHIYVCEEPKANKPDKQCRMTYVSPGAYKTHLKRKHNKEYVEEEQPNELGGVERSTPLEEVVGVAEEAFERHKVVEDEKLIGIDDLSGLQADLLGDVTKAEERLLPFKCNHKGCVPRKRYTAARGLKFHNSYVDKKQSLEQIAVPAERDLVQDEIQTITQVPSQNGADILIGWANNLAAGKLDIQAMIRDLRTMAFALDLLYKDMAAVNIRELQEKARKWDQLDMLAPTIKDILTMIEDREKK